MRFLAAAALLLIAASIYHSAKLMRFVQIRSPPPASTSPLAAGRRRRRLLRSGKTLPALMAGVRQAHCKGLLLDLGANVGDVIALAANGALGDTDFRPEDATFVPRQARPKKALEEHIGAFFGRMADTCAVGVEGNPRFTESLKRIEEVLNSRRPPLLLHTLLLTETVVSNEDGEVTFYLDTINDDKNAWGSTLAKSGMNVQCGEEARFSRVIGDRRPDIVDKSKSVDCDKVRVTVDAFRVSAILREAMRPPFAGKKMLIKMDIEGAEYPVLDEMAASGVVCDFTRGGGTAAMVLETHQNSLQGAFAEFRGPVFQRNVQALKDCGMTIYRGERFTSGF